MTRIDLMMSSPQIMPPFLEIMPEMAHPDGMRSCPSLVINMTIPFADVQAQNNHKKMVILRTLNINRNATQKTAFIKLFCLNVFVRN
jgi:hypothetical protein